MAVMKKKGDREVPAMATTSLPDVVYIILFFFMLSTSMREEELLVNHKLPDNISEVQKLEKKSLVSHIHIGVPVEHMQAKYGTNPLIQLNDSFYEPKDILDFIAAERDKLDEADRAAMTVCLKIDNDVHMGYVTNVKQELRKASALKISYGSTNDKANKNK